VMTRKQRFWWDFASVVGGLVIMAAILLLV
jgi:hypothetical protein